MPSRPTTLTPIRLMLLGLALSAAPSAAQAPSLSKLFTDDPVLPGGTVTLQLTLSHDEGDVVDDATQIAFTDDLDLVLPGASELGILTALPINVCGGTLAAVGNVLDFSGGTLTPFETCGFSLTLSVPSDAPNGSFTNTTSAVTATVGGMAEVGGTASDDLDVISVSFTKTFLDDPTVPGGVLTLELELSNLSAASTASSLAFTDSLTAALAGLTYNGGNLSPACANGSGTLTGTTLLSFTGGSLGPGETCTLTLVLDVPAGAVAGEYLNTTSALAAEVDMVATVLPAASDAFTVASDLLAVGKEFLDDPVMAGGTVTMRLEVANTHPTLAASGLTLTDDLGAALAGLSLSSVDVNDCGLVVAGTTNLSITGGPIPASATCTLELSLLVPVATPAGTYTNTTGQATATLNGSPIVGAPASDDLRVAAVSFAKAFAGPAAAGGTVVLTFTITNLDAEGDLSELGFQDDLDATLGGLVSTGLPAMDVCGAGSSLNGTSTVLLSGGSVPAAGACSFDVTLQVPAGALPGSYPNTTTELFAGGLPVALPATATLDVAPPPVFAKVFSPSAIVAGDVATLTFTIDNTASAFAATALDFTDLFPAGLLVASPPNAATTCTAGTLTAVAGTASVTYSGGTVAAGMSCTVVVEVTAAAPGMLANTSGNLTSSAGDSGTASDTLPVNAAPVPTFVKAFAPAVIGSGGVAVLTLTIDNTAALVDATGLDLSDVLPAGMLVASPSNAGTDCLGGTLTAVGGTDTVSYTGGTVPAGSTCSVFVDVTVDGGGTYVNTTADLVSSLGTSGAATATLSAGAAPVVEVPTLGGEGLAFLAGLVGALGALALRRRG